jgi:hypothetical protein
VLYLVIETVLCRDYMVEAGITYSIAGRGVILVAAVTTLLANEFMPMTDYWRAQCLGIALKYVVQVCVCVCVCVMCREMWRPQCYVY